MMNPCVIEVIEVGVQGPPGPPGIDAPGSIVARTAGAALSALIAVWEDEDGAVWPLDWRDAAHIDLLAGVTRTAALAGDEITIQRAGVVDAAGLGLVPGPVWIGEDGRLTQTPPVDGFDVYLGPALSGSRMILSPAEPIFLE
ncbi:MAG: hypothetical protein LBF50_08905 [Azoarcus sp.]|jgi:hypothetical protein|nr:hypothetical protein [Azoarcus sp.]